MAGVGAGRGGARGAAAEAATAAGAAAGVDVICCVFRVGRLTDPLHKFKVRGQVGAGVCGRRWGLCAAQERGTWEGGSQATTEIPQVRMHFQRLVQRFEPLTDA